MNKHLSVLVVLSSVTWLGCSDDELEMEPEVVLAQNIYAPLGEIRPDATAEERATFERGREVAIRRFTPEQGLGPTFNVGFCTACHERPAVGGSAGHYRDFLLQVEELPDGAALAGSKGGVVDSYGIGDAETRPALDAATTHTAGRNPIPMFGVGLVAELPDAAILANADPDDADGDGISGRPNLDQGFVGRFGRKSQTVSIEGFIRGPLFNHVGITTDPLPEELLDALPVPSGRASGVSGISAEGRDGEMGVSASAQVAAPAEPLTDDDLVADPEMSAQELFDLVAFSMLLAAPQADPLNDASERGLETFEEIGCTSCHVPALVGPRGGLPLYSDLLLHDMGEELADGIEMGVAEGYEFRTQPLWGVTPVGPYLHDGRADTLEEAILMHGGEAQAASDRFAGLDTTQQTELVEFLLSLGGASQYSTGLLPPDADLPEVNAPGGPTRALSTQESELWLTGRELFDRDTGIDAGLGPLFNGDSCRACHFDPTIGGSGPIDVNVMRHGTWTETGEFIAPEYGTILSKLAIPGRARREHTAAHNVFETRQTPTTMGLGLIETIADDIILALADPDDEDGDGIRGVAHVLPDGRLGRLGWKANVPSVREFIRDAMSNEMGMTVPEETDMTFGFLSDDDGVPDPELSIAELDAMTFFMQQLAAPQPQAAHPEGLDVFEAIGCANCHVPSLPGSDGPVALYSDVLLHAVGPPDRPGIPDGMATEAQFRTPPLWGLSQTAPYLHDGSASTVRAAIEAHEGEAESARQAYETLSEAERADLIEFLENL